MNIDLQAREISPIRNTFAHVAKYIGEDKVASRYQEGTYGAQPMVNYHYRPTWAPEFELFDTRRTKIKLADWYVLRDPRQFYYGTWTMTRARQQEAVETNYQFAESRALIAKIPESTVELALQVLAPLRHVAWGGNMNNSQICAIGYGTVFTAPAMFHAMDSLGVAQNITRLALSLGESVALENAKQAWLNDPVWQSMRNLVEDSFVVGDPFELFVAQNLVVNGMLYPLIFGDFVDVKLADEGGVVIAGLTSFVSEWHDESAKWVDSVVKTAAMESPENRKIISEWIEHWKDRSILALAPISEKAFGETGAEILSDVLESFEQRCQKILGSA